MATLVPAIFVYAWNLMNWGDKKKKQFKQIED